MSRDFFQVQRRQRRRSAFLLALLALIYAAAFVLPFLAIRYIVVLLFGPEPGHEAQGVAFWSWGPLGFALALAVALLAAQVWMARIYAVKRLIDALGAADPDPQDRYHRRFANLVEEMAIAAGRPGRVRPVVAPAMAMTAFAAEDARSGAVVGVTEGLLARLSRDQIQAVVAQEMAHIREGDALLTSFICAVMAPFQDLAEFFERFDSVAGDQDMEYVIDIGRTQMSGATRWLVGALTRRPRREETAGVSDFLGPIAMLARLACTTVSREREILADAGAAQYTRNPLALAEALHQIAHHHHFMGALASGYAPLFILDPESDSLGEGQTWLRCLFSSHPPVRRRVETLMRMARADPTQIQWGAPKDLETATLGQQLEKNSRHNAPDAWFLKNGPDWIGPLATADLLAHAAFGAEAWVMQHNIFTPILARQHPDLRSALERKAAETHAKGADKAHGGPSTDPTNEERSSAGQDQAGPSQPQAPLPDRAPRANPVGGLCPHCVAPLSFREYEGTTVRHCAQCAGNWLKEDQVKRVLARRENAFPEEFRRKVLEWHRANWARRETDLATAPDDPLGGLYCPDCGQPLVRRFYSYQYFVVVDRCYGCQAMWFDRDELETLQVLQETKPAPPPR